jgi:hypothetical protein
LAPGALPQAGIDRAFGPSPHGNVYNDEGVSPGVGAAEE